MNQEPETIPASESPRGRLDLSAGYIPITAITVFVGATVWLTSELSSINNRLANIEGKLGSSWSKVEMENWVLRAQKAFPGLPDVPH